MAPKVAVAGGSGNVAQDVIDAIVTRGVYDVVILSRKDGENDANRRIEWRRVDYDDQKSLASALSGVDTVLSFFAISDQVSAFETHKSLIDASISARVRRFAPSEWASASNSGVAHYAYKDEVRKYLESVNRDEKKIEYCLFQPGFFTNYFAYPHKTAKHFHVSQMFADFEKKRAIIIENEEFPLTLTTVEDTARLLAQALEYPGQWPADGGFRGTQTTISEFIALGERIRGPFTVERIPESDLEAGKVEVSWYPLIDHPGVPVEIREAVSKRVLKEYITSLARGAWSVSDTWNQLLPEFKFTPAEEYLGKVWAKHVEQ